MESEDRHQSVRLNDEATRQWTTGEIDWDDWYDQEMYSEGTAFGGGRVGVGLKFAIHVTGTIESDLSAY